jgi:hypothetical protein
VQVQIVHTGFRAGRSEPYDRREALAALTHGGRAMTAQIIHREFGALRWAIAVATAAGAALLAVAIATTYPATIRGLCGMLGIVGLFVAWFAVGIYRMNRIVLTDDHLIVGREVFTRDDIDPLFGVQPPVLLAPDEQHRIEDLIPLPAGGDIRIVGGSWGRRIGTATVLLRDATSGQLLAVFSRQPRLLDQRLTRWLTAVPDTPAEITDPDEPV